jgi:hypothetical protein
MAFKSTEPPLCRYCGKSIPKHTRLVNIKSEYQPHGTAFSDVVEGPLYSKNDCERATNKQVVSVSYRTSKKHREEEREIAHFSTWDGESYADSYFCGGRCIARFAYFIARRGRCTNLYNAAVRRRDAKPTGVAGARDDPQPASTVLG